MTSSPDREPSNRSTSDTSSTAANDVCRWCRRALGKTGRADRQFCDRKCRQRAFRIRRRHLVEEQNTKPKRFAYADPPYMGRAFLYQDQPTYAGEVDHPALVARLEAGYDGFALSCSSYSLTAILPLFRVPTRVCAWVKPIGCSGRTYGLHSCWEPLIVVPGRRLRPGKRDFLIAQPARGGGSDLIGRKPEAFCVWLFDVLGILPGDTLDDLFPGTGIVGNAWRELCLAQASRTAPSDSRK